ncbi:MAG TPA: hypothetical protein VF164_00630, partial [Trueperaceae bacterium]
MVRGKPSLMFLKYIGSSTAAPSTVTVTLTDNAAAGATSLTVSALSAAIPKNTVLTFSRAAGDPATMKVVVTADADVSDTTISVEDFEGVAGDGIPHSLATGDAATWDGLYTDIASNNLDFARNEQTQDLNPVTHGSATGVSVSIPEITSIAPSIQRQGLFWADGQLIKDILQYGGTNANFYAKLVIPDEDGNAFVTYAGYGKVMGVGHPSPADNLVQLNYTFRFASDVTPTFAS